MSFINFESARVKEAERENKRKAREAVLRKAEEEYIIRKQKEDRAKLHGDDKWILPSVEKRLKKESKKEKKHKKHQKKKKKSKSKRKSSSSDSEESSEEEWIEHNTDMKSSVKNEETQQKQPGENTSSGANQLGSPAERDEWMTLPGLLPCVSKEELRQRSGKMNKAEQQAQKEKYLLDSLGQSDRELNPYWKDGGKGVPEEKDSKDAVKLPEKTVGDQGADWLRRALKRAKEQAKEEGRSLEDVAAERWGSLKNLEKMLEEAENRYKTKITHGEDDQKKQWYTRKKEKREGNEKDIRDKHRTTEHSSSHYSRSEDRKYHSYGVSRDFSRSENKRLFRKPAVDDDNSQCTGAKPQKGFWKPEADDDHNKRSLEQREYKRGAGNWRKKDASKQEEDRREKPKESKRKKSPTSSESSISESENEDEKQKLNEEVIILTDQQMNDLGAKIVKAEILGNEELAAELKKKLVMAREARKKLTSENNDADNGSVVKEEIVILTKTTSQGFSHPLQSTSPMEPSGGRRKKKKIETHADGKRVRYFADDDKYSLREMFEKEKLTTTEDQNAMFARLAGKSGGSDDMDEVFVDEARRKQSEGKIQTGDRWKAIKEHKKVEKALDNCNWCFDSKQMLKHLIIAIGNKVYLCLPPHQSLTEGHCFIVPMYHTPCATQLDEDVWNEMQTFRKTLVSMFREKLDQDVVFFESAMHLNRFPHMLLECVPMVKETCDLAPIYFKKAIMESEHEWAINKKVVDLKGKNVRRAVPKGLPYFCVDFGEDPGFAHVIENEKDFPRNFAQEIIGGMLELEHNLWRKPRRENFDEQRRKVMKFAHWWKSYDFTVKKRNDSSSESE